MQAARLILLLSLVGAAFGQTQRWGSRLGLGSGSGIGVCNNVAPGPARDIAALAGDASITLTWAAPNNNPCSLDAYKISVRPAEEDGMSSHFETTSTRATINKLTNGVKYVFTIQSQSKDFPGQGGSASVTAAPGIRASAQTSGNASIDTPRAGDGTVLISGPRQPAPGERPSVMSMLPGSSKWQCKPEKATYPICPAGKAGLCTPISCADVVTLGRCSHPELRKTNWQDRTITQYCSDVCGCSPEPSLRVSFPLKHGDKDSESYCCAFQTGDYYVKEGKP